MEHLRALRNLSSGGFRFSATNAEVAAVLEDNGIACGHVEADDAALRHELAEKKVGMMLDLSRTPTDAHIRRASIEFNVPLFTDMQQIKMLGKALELDMEDLLIQPYSDYDFSR